MIQESKTCLLLSSATSALPPAVLSAGSDQSRLSAAGVLERPVPCGSSTGSTVQHWQQQEQRGAWEPLSNSSWQGGAGKPEQAYAGHKRGICVRINQGSHVLSTAFPVVIYSNKS